MPAINPLTARAAHADDSRSVAGSDKLANLKKQRAVAVTSASSGAVVPLSPDLAKQRRLEAAEARDARRKLQQQRADAVARETTSRRWKTLYAFICCILPIASIAFVCLALASGDIFESLTALKTSSAQLAGFFGLPSSHTFSALGAINQNSTCTPLVFVGEATLAFTDTLLTTLRVLTSTSVASDVLLRQQIPFGCRDLGDAIVAASRLAIGLVTGIFIACCVSVYELAAFGPYGGSRAFGRVSFILSCICAAMCLLLLVAWYWIASVKFCSAKKSLMDYGFGVGWPFFLSCGVLALLIIDLIQAAKKMGRIQRGPPTMTILYRSVVLCASCFGVFAQGWLVMPRGHLPSVDLGNGVVSLSGWGDACVSWIAEYPCPNLKLYANLLLVAAAVTAGAGLFCVLYTALRAVDSAGATLMWSSGFGLVLVVFTIGIAVGVYAASTVNGQTCERADRKSLLDLGFELGMGSWLLVPALTSSFTFFFMNVVYSYKCAVSRDDAEYEEAALEQHRTVRGAMQAAVFDISNLNDMGADLSATNGGLSPSSRRADNNNKRAAAASAVDSAEGKEKKKYLYHLMWWNGLRDSRTAAILDREAHDARQDADGDDDEGVDVAHLNGDHDEKGDGPGYAIGVQQPSPVNSAMPPNARAATDSNFREQNRSPNVSSMLNVMDD